MGIGGGGWGGGRARGVGETGGEGITLGKHATFLHELIAEFDALGYEVVQPWRVLNAAWFGVPQSRERLFLMGAKRGRGVPMYPQPQFRAAGASPVSALPLGPSCLDALGDLPDAERYSKLNFSDTAKVSWGRPSSFAAKLRGLISDQGDFSYFRQWDAALLTSSMRTEHSDISRRRFGETEEGRVEPISRFFKLPSDGVANTLRAGTDSARGAFTSPRPIHYKYHRCITVREMARLHSFPDWFRFHQTKWHGARQIGNAVPPLLARAVAQQIVQAIGASPSKPAEGVPLGDAGLLQLDMGQAADWFGVENPIKQRDRKGAPKRRQWDERLPVPLRA